MATRLSILQICSVVAVLNQRTGFVPTSAQFFAVGTFLILVVSVLYSFWYQCVSFMVLLPTDPSKNLTQNCHFLSQPQILYVDLRDCPT